MQRINLNKTNLSPTFIGSWIITPPSLCDSLITYFEENAAKQEIGTTGGRRDLYVKDRVDICITTNELNLPGMELFRTYINCLFTCYQDYLVQWPFLEKIGDNLEIGAFNFGRYQKGQHFQKLHAERSSIESLHRVLAWMTYLNDVDEGGETHFSHYDINVKPKKGLTLIWPAEWTHAHRGNILREESKYMLTGWMNFRE